MGRETDNPPKETKQLSKEANYGRKFPEETGEGCEIARERSASSGPDRYQLAGWPETPMLKHLFDSEKFPGEQKWRTLMNETIRH